MAFRDIFWGSAHVYGFFLTLDKCGRSSCVVGQGGVAHYWALKYLLVVSIFPPPNPLEVLRLAEGRGKGDEVWTEGKV